MNLFFLIFIFFFLFYFLNNLLKRFNSLSNYKGRNHQKFFGVKNTPLSGGIFFIVSIVSLFYFYKIDYLLTLFLFLIFFIGFISDIDFLSSPKFRFLIQSLVVIIFVYLLDIQVNQTKFILLDLLLKNLYFKYFFSVFCLLILINGSNFIDGLNGLMIGYFTSIFIIILYLDLYFFIGIEKNLMISIIMILIFLLFLNINNKLFMGDSGSYVLGLLCGYILIKIYEFNQEISPYFIVLLLWYPCFENLFSILRKFSLNRSPVNPDNNHLHQLIFFYLDKKIIYKKIYINNFSSFLIIFYNILVFLIGLSAHSNSQLQIILITMNILVYLIVYIRLFIFKYNIKNS
jgi:UDP-N-acetylmuramyl pentapeptide phosphotransferase/UDP-N-acetylglucosamine-1-phosphate transferase